MNRRPLWPLLLGAGLGFLLLMSLGVWQVQRLAWKEAAIAAINTRLGEPAVLLTDAASTPALDGTIAKVTVTGRFLPVALRKIAVFNGGPGWEILQGFEMAGGRTLLVARGIAAEGQSLEVPAGDLTLTGLLRQHETRSGFFDPANDVAGNRWYTWDVPAMAHAAFGEGKSADLAVLHLLPGSSGTEGLHVEAPKAELRNNHLGYALTWFGLAATLVVMTGLLVRQRRKQS